tara:strand:- start:3662 stop:3850 length:189 start_codon:yes stop_codon:yes gene_type:complete
MVKEAHKDLKRKVNLQEEVRRNDRSFTSWKELKDLKKIKLALKDKLLKSKNNERGNKTISKV